jgi:arylsulfatase A-like enzyme
MFFPRGMPRNFTNQVFTLEDAVAGIQKYISNAPHPFLAYFHFYPPHIPYKTREDFVDIFDDGWAAPRKPKHVLSEDKEEADYNKQRRYYDEFIAYVDAEFGRLFYSLMRDGLLDNTYLIFTSDHGELFERGILGHITPTLYEPVIHIPLIISKPGQENREDIFSPTSSTDLLPTLLHAAGKPIPTWTEGQVLPTFSSIEPLSDRSIFAVEAKSSPKNGPLSKATYSLIKGNLKLIHYSGMEGLSEKFELYNIKDDPEELDNMFNPTNSMAAELRNELIVTINPYKSP